MAGPAALDLSRIGAAIFDMDGVVTSTARLHSRAWREMFDQYLRERAGRGQKRVEPCSEEDYSRYIDGKLRYDGVRSFLASRGIELPEGSSDDPPGKETVRGLGNLKDAMFHRLLQAEGAEVFQDTLDLLANLRGHNVRTAVISSSRNCHRVLAAAGMEDAFEAVVDGVESDRLGLAGKPAPDIFLQAARCLGVRPQQAVVFEDAPAGVEAARQGSFAMVIGVARRGQAELLRQSGADAVVEDLRTVRLENVHPPRAQTPPHAMERFAELRRRLDQHAPALFLDYDGTLTPIVTQPEMARMRDDMREVIRELASRCTVAIVSGRDRADAKDLVALDEVYYAGSHGFDISGPDGFRMEQPDAQSYLDDLDEAEQRLMAVTARIPGARVERKRYAIAVHYRNVAQADQQAVEQAVAEAAAAHPRLRRRGGKKIFELQPDIEWHKGKAVEFLLRTLEPSGPGVIPLYLGDDVTDEDAFNALKGRGIGVFVGPPDQPTAADYRLADVDEVIELLRRINRLLAPSAKPSTKGRR